MPFTLLFEFFSISGGFLYDYWICITGGIQGQNYRSYKKRKANLSPDDGPLMVGVFPVVHLFHLSCCNKIGGPIVGIYKSLTDT